MMRITGFSCVVSSLNTMKSGLFAKLSGCLSEAASSVMAESLKITPVATGELRARAFVDNPAVTGDTRKISLGYERNGSVYPVTPSGSSEEYAVLVHERMDVSHAVGQAKFLETALKNFEPAFLSVIKDAAEEVFH